VIQSGYEQAWENWSFAGSTPISPTFSWQVVGGSNLAIPDMTSGNTWANINLNDLTAGTTYDYTIGANNLCGSATATGIFSTSGAPTNEFVGWVSQIASNPYKLDQTGSTVSGATVWAAAKCFLAPFITNVISGPYNFSGTTTNNTGHYQLGFPQTASPYIIDEGGRVPTPVTVYQELEANGECVTTDSNGDPPASHTGSQIWLYSNHANYWNTTLYTISTLSTTNDYPQFGLPSNAASTAAAGIAFIHTSVVECGVTVDTGGSQTIDAYLAGNGHDNTKSFGQLLGAAPVWGQESWDSLSYDSTGVYNQSSGSIESAWTYGANVAESANGLTSYNDPNATAPAGSIIWNVGAGIGNTWGVYNGGSYTSITRLAMSIGLSVGWSLAQGSVSVDVDYTTSAVTSTTHEIVCTSETPPVGYDYQYWVYWDPLAETNDQGINTHIWYDDTCAIPSCVA
jgi:hypothetical protein